MKQISFSLFTSVVLGLSSFANTTIFTNTESLKKSATTSFMAPCDAANIPFYEGFETGITEGDAIAGCWTQASVEGGNFWVGNSQNASYNREPKTGDWNATLRWGNERWMFYPLNLTAGTEYKLEFFARQDAAIGASIMASYGDSDTAAAMTNTIVANSAVVNGDYQEFAGTFTPTISKVYYIGIKATLDSTNPFYVSLDDISVEAVATTGCVATSVPYMLDFDDALVPDLPECTSKENLGSGNEWHTKEYNANGMSGNVLNYVYNSNHSANAWFYTQGITLESGKEYQISYNYFGSSYYPEKMKVAFGTSPGSTDMTSVLADHTSIGSAEAVIVNFTVSENGVYYFGFNVYSNADRNNLYVDNIKINIAPSCVMPSDLIASNLSASSAKLTWTANSETEWEVIYGETGFNPATEGQTTTVNIEPTTIISGLDASTTYDFYVTAICGTDDESEMAGPVTFTTTCDAVDLPYFLNFEDVTTPALPECTSIENKGNGNNWNTFSASMNGFNSKVLRYTYNTTNAANAWFYTQGINLVAGTSYKISYKYGNNSDTKVESMKVAYGTSADSAAMTEELANHPSIAGGTPSVEELTFTVDTDGVYYFGFNAYSAAFQYLLFVDDISIIVAPSCAAPRDLLVSNIGENSVDLSWTAGGSETTWEVVYGEFGFDPETEGESLIVEGEAELSLTGLSNATRYQFYVKAVCGEEDESELTGPVSFTTLCTFTSLPYVMDFESATIPSLPMCTSRENLGAGNNWTTANINGFGFDSKALFYNWSSTNDANAWFYTQGIDLEAGTAYEISYLYGNDNSYGDTEKMKVAYGTSPESAAMTSPLADHTAINSGSATVNTISFTPTEDGVYYFGFNVYSDAGNWRLYLDNIKVNESTLGLNSNDITQISYFPNPVKDQLTITAASTIENVSVYNLLGQMVLEVQPKGTTLQIDMSALPNGNYIVKSNIADAVSTFKVIKQ